MQKHLCLWCRYTTSVFVVIKYLKSTLQTICMINVYINVTSVKQLVVMMKCFTVAMKNMFYIQKNRILSATFVCSAPICRLIMMPSICCKILHLSVNRKFLMIFFLCCQLINQDKMFISLSSVNRKGWSYSENTMVKEKKFRVCHCFVIFLCF